MIGLAMLLLGQRADAASVETGNRLIEFCPSRVKDDLLRGYGLGYVIGVYDLAMSEYAKDQTFCTPDGVLNRMQVRDVVCRYLDNYPERRHLAGTTLVIDAVAEAWPCKAKP